MNITKSKIIFSSIVLLFTSLSLGCGSVQPEKSIQRGDYVTAIETLSNKLAKKPTDEKYADLFVSVYPITLEQKIPTTTVKKIIEDSLPGYKSNPVGILKRQTGTSSLSLTNNTEISQIIRTSELLISNLKDCIRIQNAVLVVPAQIGNPKKGQFYSVKKYEQNFTATYNEEMYSLGMFYYNMAEALYPGDGIVQKQEILTYYSNATNYSNSVPNVRTKCAEICYQIANEYESYADTIASKNDAITWYNKAMNWSSGYKDSQTKVYQMNYEIAMIYQRNAKTVSDYETILNYLGKAGTYKDSVNLKRDITYMLAIEYKNALNSTSYDKAGSYFKSLGNYENAQRETYLYDFYKRLVTLSTTNRYNNISLNNGSKVTNNLNRSVETATTRYTNINITNKGSTIPVYTIIKDGTISPGAMFEGDSIANEKYTSFISGDRNPLEYTIYGGTGWSKLGYGTITNPGTRTANSEVTSKALKAYRSLTPTYNVDYIQVYSDDDLAMALGTGFERNSFSIGRNADWYSNVILIKLTQKYYTASIDAPKMPYEFFSTNSTSTIRDTSLRTVSPYYVNSVDYGRAAYLVFSTDMKTEDFVAQFKDVLNDSILTSYTRRTYSTKWENSNTTVSGITVCERSTSLSSFDRVFDWIKDGRDMISSVDELPPIGFTLRCLSNNNYASFTQTGTFRILNPNYVKPESDGTTTKPSTEPEKKTGTDIEITVREPLKPISK